MESKHGVKKVKKDEIRCRRSIVKWHMVRKDNSSNKYIRLVYVKMIADKDVFNPSVRYC